MVRSWGKDWSFYSSFPNRVMPHFRIFAYAYIANSCSFLLYFLFYLLWAYNAPQDSALVILFNTF